MALTYHCVDPAAAAGGDGSTWETDGSADSAFNIAGLIADFAACAAGDVYFIKPAAGGTITLTEDILSDIVGTLNAPIGLIGVKIGTTHLGSAIDDSDFPTDVRSGGDAPHFDGGTAYSFDTEDFIRIRNISIESGDTYSIKTDSNSIVYNCKAYNDSGTAGRHAIGGSSATNGLYVSCDASSINGNASNLYTGGRALFCYFHDSSGYGIFCGSQLESAFFCIFDNLGEGIGGQSREYRAIIGCTFFDCDIAIYDSGAAQTANGHVIVNNIFSECDTADISLATASMDCFLAYNNHHNSAADKCIGVPEEGDADDLFCDWYATTVDPAFTTPGSDFSLGAASGCRDAGMAMRLGVGA